MSQKMAQTNGSSSDKVVVVSYRVPISIDQSNETPATIVENANDNPVVHAAVLALKKEGKDTLWVGSCGGLNSDSLPAPERKEIVSKLYKEHKMAPILLDTESAKLHFQGFCKGFLWPLFHYYGNSANFSPVEWEAYKNVNETFAKSITEMMIAAKDGQDPTQGLLSPKSILSPNSDRFNIHSPISSPLLNERRRSSVGYNPFGFECNDTVFLIQDYHLMMVPYFLRQRIPNAKIGFFLHVPWPSSELYRSLPVRELVLSGILAADIIGFQTFSYARHFLSCCTRILGLKVSDKGIQLSDGRFVRIEVMPIGIDASFWSNTLNQQDAKDKIEELKKSFHGKKLIVSRDRTDYVKGIPNKLKSFRTFLTMYPEWQGKVVLLQECQPNPEVTNERHYKELCEQIAQLVGSINGQFGTIQYTPIHYLNQTLKAEESAALYAAADLGIILPLRDGMNMASHEFTVCQEEKMSPLILSEFAGAAQCLSGAILANPWHEKKIAKQIQLALTMSQEDKQLRHQNNIQYVTSHTAQFWISNWVKELSAVSSNSGMQEDVPHLSYSQVRKAYNESSKRVIFLDYDGTLTPIVKLPHLAVPSSSTLNLLSTLAADPKNVVYIISGRDRKFLSEWFAKVPIGLSGEHGSFIRPFPKRGEQEPPQWEMLRKDLDLGWKDLVLPIFDDYTDRTPGSFIEMKEINISWHYRNSDPDFGEYQKNALILTLQGSGKMPIDVLSGDKCVEVRPCGINKGAVVKQVLSEMDSFDFVLCIGDDATDEDMFNELKKLENPNIFSVMVKKKPTAATAYLDNQRGVLSLLQTLVGDSPKKPTL